MGSILRNEEAPFYLTDVDREVLSQTDDQFHLQTWSDLRQIISENNLESLKRKPSDLIRYIEWTRQTKAAYGTITNFICQNRLHWEPLPVSSATDGPKFECNNAIPFADPNDYKILRNDWPYGFTPDITHLVVWLKTPVPVDQKTGDLTPESRKRVKEFVRETFTAGLARDGHAEDSVQWFKNWTRLQSVRGLEHVHVLVKDVSDDIITEWTGEGRRSS
ncbi:hypothetical protein MMC16_003776 [Acarospora aff. strigata]|nr:hypothetical protein [Acarospora aff. strigata]